jgi:GNAT superfamily N-acetyltransferase
MDEQLLKDFIATAQKYNYDWATVFGKFPELQGYDQQALKDYVATAEKNNYDYSVVNNKFPEFFQESKKKEEPSTALPSAGGVSASPAQQTNRFGFYQPEPVVSESTRLPQPIQETETKIAQAQQSKEKMYANTPGFVKEEIEKITPDLIGKEEQEVVPQMNYKFGPLGFKFEQSGMTGDWMKVTAPNGESMEVSLDPFTKGKELSESFELKRFIAKNSQGIKGIDKIEQQYIGQNKKFSSDEEVNKALEDAKQKSQFLNLDIKKYLSMSQKLEEEGLSLDKVQGNERNTEEFKQRYNAYMAQKDLLNNAKQKLIEKQAQIPKQQDDLKRAIGQYTSMKGEQGTWYDATAKAVINGVEQLATWAGSQLIDFKEGIMTDPRQQLKDPAVAKHFGILTKDDYDKFVAKMDKMKIEEYGPLVNKIQDLARKAYKYGDEETGLVGYGDFMKDIASSIAPESLSKQYEQEAKKGLVSGSLLGTVESIPSFLGGGWMSRVARMYAQSEQAEMEKMSDNPNFANVSEEEKRMVAAPIAVANAVLEEIGFRNIIGSKGVMNSLVGKALGDKVATASAQSFAEFIRNEVKSGLARGTLTAIGGALAEAETGATQQFAEMAIEDLYNIAKNKKDEDGNYMKMFNTPDSIGGYLKEIAIGGLQEAIGGLVLGSPHALSEAFSKNDFNGISDAHIEIAEKFKNDTRFRGAYAQMLQTQINQGQITKEQAQKQLDNYTQSAGLLNSIPEGLNNAQKRKALGLLKEKTDLTNEIQGKDEAITKKQRDRITEINSQLEQISNAVQEQTTGEGVLRQEVPGLELQPMGEGNQKPQVAATGTEAITDEEKKKITDRIAEIEGIISGDNAAIADTGKGKLLTDARTELETELNDLKEKIKEQPTAGIVEIKPGSAQAQGEVIEVKLPEIKGTTEGLDNGITIEQPISEFGDIDYDAEQKVRDIAKERNLGITSDREIAYVAKDNQGNIVGGAFTSYDGDKYTFDVVVSKEAESKGVGSRLLNSVIQMPIEISDSNPDATIEVDVVSTKMKSMLESRGFKVDRQIGDGRFIMSPSSSKATGQGPVIEVKLPEIEVTSETIKPSEQQNIITNETEQLQPAGAGERTGRQEVGRLAPLEGAPSVQGINGPDPQLVAVAEKYAAENGIDLKRQSEYVTVDEDRARRIAAEYEKMEHNPKDPKVREAYQNLIKQTVAQYKALVDAGYKFWFIDMNLPSNAEYASSPYNALRSMRQDKEMGVFPTTDGFGSSDLDVENNPLLAETGFYWGVGGVDGELKPVLANDLFRAVHDAFGHGLEGAGFRARGEENAWQAHVRLFTGSAVGAITSETRGQNSWLNFGPHGETNRNASVEDTIFADQKSGLMPEWTWTEGRAGDMQAEAQPTQEEQEKSLGEITYDILDDIDKKISARLFGGANESLFAIPLGTLQVLIKGVKALVKGGMTVQRAIMKIAKENNLSLSDVSQSIKEFTAIAEIKDGFDAVMTKVDAMIARQKKTGTDTKKIISNVDTLIRNSEVYKNANDLQKKVMERAGRLKMEAKPRRAPSIGRIIGALKDMPNATLADKLRIVKNLRELAKDAAKDLAKELRAMANEGSITVGQAANLLARFGKVNLLNEVSVTNFVNYAAKVFNNAEYAGKMNQASSLIRKAKKNIRTKLGVAENLMPMLERMLDIDPAKIPDTVLNSYMTLVEMLGANQAVLKLADIDVVTSMTNAILDEVNEQSSLADELAIRLESYDKKVLDSDGKLNYAETIKNMVADETITAKEAELMSKYKTDILPQVEPEEKSKQETEEENAELVDAAMQQTVNYRKLSMADERRRAYELRTMLKPSILSRMTNEELKRLLRVIDNINNGYFPHSAELMLEDMNAIENSQPLDSSISSASVSKIGKAYAKLKSLFTDKGAILEMVRRSPLYFIDQVFGDFKSKAIFNAVFEKVAEAQSLFKAELDMLNKKLEMAHEAVSKSFNNNTNATLLSSYKMMTYMIQQEHDSNPDSDQVNPAAKYLQATIKHIDGGNSNLGEREANMLQSILDNYGVVVGQDAKGNDIIEIDTNKLYQSFNAAERNAMKTIREVNDSLTEKAMFTSSVIRGDKISPLVNYIHLPVMYEYGPDDLSRNVSLAESYNNSRRPSTKAKSLIERTKNAKPINFDVFMSAERGVKFTLMDYHMTAPIRTARKTLNRAKVDMESKGRVPKFQREVFNAINNAFEEATSNMLTNNFIADSFGDMVVNYLSKQGYRAILASVPRFISELSSNIGYAVISDPGALFAGLQQSEFIMSPDAVKAMMNVKSKQLGRIFHGDTLQGRMIDTQILSQTSGVRGGKARGKVMNKVEQIYNLTLKKFVKNPIEFSADALISTPDKMVMRPIWFGSFSNEFKRQTGQDVDLNKIAANDESYMNRYKEALDRSRDFADERSVLAGASENAFMGILKGTTKPNQSVLTRAFNNFNNFMTKFAIYEYTTARQGIYAMMGNGTITKKQGAALLAGVATRMTVYTLLTSVLGSALVGMFRPKDDDEEEEKTFAQKFGQALAGTATTLMFGRDFGNASRSIINYGVERGNEKFLGALRKGDYDPYKDAIQYNMIPQERKGHKTNLTDYIQVIGGSFTPALKTLDLAIQKATEPPKKKEEAIERANNEVNVRLPLEALGNLGWIPLYKDVRKVVMDNMYSDLRKAEAKKSKDTEENASAKEYEDMMKAERKEETAQEREDKANVIRGMLQKGMNPSIKSIMQEKLRELEMTDEERSEYRKERKSELADKKEELNDLLKGYDSKSDMKRYDPKLYEKTFGKKSKYYKKYRNEIEAEDIIRKKEREIEDKKYGYTPKKKRKY